MHRANAFHRKVVGTGDNATDDPFWCGRISLAENALGAIGKATACFTVYGSVTRAGVQGTLPKVLTF